MESVYLAREGENQVPALPSLSASLFPYPSLRIKITASQGLTAMEQLCAETRPSVRAAAPRGTAPREPWGQDGGLSARTRCPRTGQGPLEPHQERGHWCKFDRDGGRLTKIHQEARKSMHWLAPPPLSTRGLSAVLNLFEGTRTP